MKVVSECALMAKWSYCKGNLTYVTGWGEDRKLVNQNGYCLMQVIMLL